jgi:hypothetical protein
MQMAVAQTSQQYSLRVNGNPVSTTRSPVRLSDQWFVPLASIARALGAEIRVDPVTQTLRVVRNDGVTTSYDGVSGRILQGSVVAAQLESFREIQLSIGLENILFPLDGVVALFGVTVRENRDEDVLDIETSASSIAGGAASGAGVHLASLNDRYSFASNGQTWQQSLNLHGEALAGDRRFTASLDLARVNGLFLGFRQGFIRLETASHRVLTIGDQGTNSGVEALANTVRGVGYQWTWRGFTAETYGGRAASSVAAALGSSGVAVYDTNIAGFSLHRHDGSSEFSIGGDAFGGGARSGSTFGVAYTGTFARNQFRVQGVTGYFSGAILRSGILVIDANNPTQSAGGIPAGAQITGVSPLGSVIQVEENAGTVRGGAYGFSVSDSFSPFGNKLLLLTGIWEQYSRNFLVARDDSRFSAISRKSLTASMRANGHISFSGALQNSRSLLGESNAQLGYSYGVSVSGPAKLPVQIGYFSSASTSGAGAGRLVLSQYSLQLPRINRYSFNATYSEMRFAGLYSRAIRESASADFKRYGRFGVHDQLQFRSAHSYGADWSHRFGKEIYLMAGVDRQTSPRGAPTISPVAAITLPLPKNQSFTVSYYSAGGSSLLRFEIGGSPMAHRELVAAGNGRSALIVPSSLSGQVYYDVNYDGQFKSGVDRVLPEMRVWLDRNVSTTTDGSGYFHFDGITPGTHRLHVDMSSLPANLVFVSDDLKVAVMPYYANRQDFRAIPTGSIRGTVRISQLNGDGRTVVTSYPDVRLIASGNKDTFSEGDGNFVLGDLPPGTYQLHVDPVSLPTGFVPSPATRTIEVKPGQSSGNVDFLLAKPIIMKTAPPSKPSAAH